MLISADFDPASILVGPFFTSHLHHLFSATSSPSSCALADSNAAGASRIGGHCERYGKVYGTDYAFLGYKEGKELVIKNVGQNIFQQFPTDHFGKPLSEIPVMNGRPQAKNFPLFVSISAGFPGLNEYVLQIQGQYDLKMVGVCTAVGGPDYIPFYKSKQLLGLSMGMPGSAQYEQLVWKGKPAEGVKLLATSAMDVLNLGHLFIILLIVFGNIAFFITRRVEEA